MSSLMQQAILSCNA